MFPLCQSLLINGVAREPESGSYRDIVNPATGEVIGQAANATIGDVDAAVAAAKAAFPGWSRTPVALRAQVLLGLAGVLGQHLQELATLDALTSGSSMARLMQFDLMAGLQIALGFAQKLETYPFTTVPPVRPIPEAWHVRIVKEALGVCALIPAWNAPLLLALLKLIPALAAGNTVVIKPAENTSFGTHRLAELLQAILPPGVVNVVTGDGALVGGRLTEHPDVAKISFTGSCRVGKEIEARAAGTLKKVTLELGGKGPAIVLPGADLDLAARGITYGYLLHAGQVCISGTRVIVHSSIHDALVEKLVALAETVTPGNPLDPATTLTPMASAAHCARVLSYIEAGRREGAILTCGGERLAVPGLGGGHFIAPTIFTGVTNDMTIAREEIFGPVLSVMRYDDIEDAIATANATTYGLSAGIWTGDPVAANGLASRLKAGLVWVNEWHAVTPDTPFGGLRESGHGKEISLEAIEGYLDTKSVITSFERHPANKPLQRLVLGAN